MKKNFIILCLLMFIAVMAAGQPPCYVPTGALDWGSPEADTNGFISNTVVVFAKKVPLVYCISGMQGEVVTDSTVCPVYINIEEPTKDPWSYDTPDTNLVVLEGAVSSNLQYENDSLAMLIFRDSTGINCFDFSGLEDSIYFFAIFNTVNGVYSNASYARGTTIAVQRVFTILMANSTRLQWRKDPSIAIDTVICVYSLDPLTVKPTGHASKYLTGVNKNYAINTSYLNGVNADQGKILYNSIGDRTVISGLPLGEVYINIFTNQDTCWSKPVTRLIDTR